MRALRVLGRFRRKNSVFGDFVLGGTTCNHLSGHPSSPVDPGGGPVHTKQTHSGPKELFRPFLASWLRARRSAPSAIHEIRSGDALPPPTPETDFQRPSDTRINFQASPVAQKSGGCMPAQLLMLLLTSITNTEASATRNGLHRFLMPSTATKSPV